MKIIISHDIDHITASEHLSDLFLVKYSVRNILELFSGIIPLSEYLERGADIFKNRFCHSLELVEFERHMKVPSCFFIAVRKGLGLSYNNEQSVRIANQLVSLGIPVGIHGMESDNYMKILQERDLFTKLTSIPPGGIRMHYLRTSSNTFQLLERAGYKFDSSVLSLENPYKIGNLWEFPVHLMDSSVFYCGSKYQKKSFKEVQEITRKTINKACERNIRYFNIVTHDFYFSDSFQKWKQWYIWLIDLLMERGFEFCLYEAAIEDLNRAK